MTFQPGAMINTQGFGNRPENVEVPFYASAAPTTSDTGSPTFPVGKVWIDQIGNAAYTLTSLSTIGGVIAATWVTTGGGAGAVATLTGNAGAAAPVAGNINIVGTGTLSFAGAGSTLTGSITPGTTLLSTLTGSSGGAISPTAGNITLAAGTGMLSTAGAGSTITFNVNFAAPPALGSGTPANVSATALTAVGTASINASGAAVTTIGTGGTGAVFIGNATGNTAVTGSLTATTTLTATLGAITATNGNFVGSTAGTGVLFNSPAASGVAASPVVVNGRTGQATFTTVSIAAGADLTLTITNSAITGATTQVIYSMSGATTGAALSIKSVTNSAGSSAIVVTNGTGATTSTADIVVNFMIIN